MIKGEIIESDGTYSQRKGRTTRQMVKRNENICYLSSYKWNLRLRMTPQMLAHTKKSRRPITFLGICIIDLRQMDIKEVEQPNNRLI